MAQIEMTMAEWAKRTRPTRADHLRFNGYSPGHVAAELGITRQAVHQAIDRGDLDAVRIVGKDGRLRAIVISQESINAFAALRAIRETA